MPIYVLICHHGRRPNLSRQHGIAGRQLPMFSEKVRMNRRRLGLTQEELAGKSGVSVRTVRDLEAGRIARPRPRTLHRLADTFALHGADRDSFFECAAPLASGIASRRPAPAGTLSSTPISPAISTPPDDDAGRGRDMDPRTDATPAVMDAPKPPRNYVQPQSRHPVQARSEADSPPDVVSRKWRLTLPRVAIAVAGALTLAVVLAVVALYWIIPESPLAPSKDVLTGYVVGAWQGILEQSDGKRLSIRLRVNEGGLTATTTYPEAKCVGVVGITEIGLDSLTYRERITSGSCSPDGSITLGPRADGRLDFYYVPASGDYTAAALLAEANIDKGD